MEKKKINKGKRKNESELIELTINSIFERIDSIDSIDMNREESTELIQLIQLILKE